MVNSITTSNKENGISYWEKQIKDVSNVDEKFANARDIGFLRMNYARNTVLGSLSKKFDSFDMYKIQVQSNGKLALSARTSKNEGEDGNVLDLSKYQDALDEAMKMTDPEGWEALQVQRAEEDKNKKLIQYTAPGLRIEVYMQKGGRDVLIADSHAEEGSKLREAADQMFTGEYRAQKGNYYIKVSRDDTIDADSEQGYALQTQLGTSFRHEYSITEAPSDDVKNKKASTRPSLDTSTISYANVLEIQASKYQATAQMLQVGYLNMADIYNKNSKY